MKCPTLRELPSPPPEKTGWPWTEESPQLPDCLSDGSEWPKISIVTPSYNQGEFIEETIRSVLLQGYPNLEYIIIDGGSTDGSVEIIRKYESWLTYWISEPDRGQSSAINKGFSHATGEILGWINSDDYYQRNALHRLILLQQEYPSCVAWIGACREIDIQGKKIRIVKPKIGGKRDLADWEHKSGFYQPSCLFSRQAFFKIQGLNEKLHYVLDVDLWIRLRECGNFAVFDEVVSAARLYSQAKTFRDRAMREAEQIATNFNLDMADIARSRLIRYAKKEKDSMTYKSLFIYFIRRTQRGLSPASIKQKLIALHDRIQNSFSYRSRGFWLALLNYKAKKIRNRHESLLRKRQLNINDQFTFTIACMVGKKQLIDLLFALLSFHESVGSIGRVSILSDGSLDSEDKKFLESWNSKCKVFLSVKECCDYYQYIPQEPIDLFSQKIIWGKKLLLLLAVQNLGNCLLMDSDVIFFNNPLQVNSALFKCISNEICCCFEDFKESFDPAIIEYSRQQQIEASKKINDGLVYIPKQRLNNLNWDKIIPHNSILEPHIFTNMSALSVGLQKVGYVLLPKEEFMVSPRGTGFPKDNHKPFCDIKESYGSLICRHFVTPVRYLMWLKAFPFLKKKIVNLK